MICALRILNEETPREFFKRRGMGKPDTSYFGGVLRYRNGQFTWSDGTPGAPYIVAVPPSRYYNFRCDGNSVIIPKRYWHEEELAWIKAYPAQSGVRRVPISDFYRHDKTSVSAVYWPMEYEDEVRAKAKSLGAKL